MINYEQLTKNLPVDAIINITDECNLRCKYCFTHPNPSIMKLDTGIAAVQWLVDNYEKREDDMKKEVHINFFGGEPMLRYEELMVPLMEWTDKNIKLSGGHQVTWGMTTNGTLLTKDRLRYLAKRGDFQILFSCDGAPETQNLQRRTKNDEDSFPLIDKNIDYLLEYFPETTFRSTVTPESVSMLMDNYLYAKKRGFKNYFCMPNCREKWSLEAIQELGYQLSNIGWFIYQDIINDRPILRYNDIFSFMVKYITQPKESLTYDHCGFGCSSVGITTNGLITGCQERNTKDINDLFFIGDIYSGIDKNKHLKLLAQAEDKERNNNHLDCENCPIKNFCSGRICPSTCYDMSGQATTSNDITCYWHIILYKIAEAICETAALENNKKFQDFLFNIGNTYLYM